MELPGLSDSMAPMEQVGSKEMETEVAVLLAGQEGPVLFLAVLPVEMAVLGVQEVAEHLPVLVAETMRRAV
jgi:hypothetical protein